MVGRLTCRGTPLSYICGRPLHPTNLTSQITLSKLPQTTVDVPTAPFTFPLQVSCSPKCYEQGDLEYEEVNLHIYSVYTYIASPMNRKYSMRDFHLFYSTRSLRFLLFLHIFRLFLCDFHFSSMAPAIILTFHRLLPFYRKKCTVSFSRTF